MLLSKYYFEGFFGSAPSFMIRLGGGVGGGGVGRGGGVGLSSFSIIILL